ncbi:MAG: hypothetical protein Kow0013_25870 [Pararhodobacter sp.]
MGLAGKAGQRRDFGERQACRCDQPARRIQPEAPILGHQRVSEGVAAPALHLARGEARRRGALVLRQPVGGIRFHQLQCRRDGPGLGAVARGGRGGFQAPP